jgi:hypothetical protein
MGLTYGRGVAFALAFRRDDRFMELFFETLVERTRKTCYRGRIEYRTDRII